jgi:hypothetical protein
MSEEIPQELNEKLLLNVSQKEQLMKIAVYNRSFALKEMIAEMHITFEMIGADRLVLFDKWIIANQQFRICMLEIDKLKIALGNVKIKET